MKTCKRLIALLLCCVLLIPAATFHVHAAGGAPYDEHHTHTWVSDGARTVTDYCGYDSVELALEHCSGCGAKRGNGFRPNGPSNGQQHNWVTAYTDSGCSAHPNTEKYCTTCGYVDLAVTSGGHVYDGNTETKEATCTEKGYTRTYCECGDYTETVIDALNHNWVQTEDGTCKKGQRCTICGEVIPGQDHIWEPQYRITDNGHFKKCVYCKETTGVSPHVDQGNGYCECGYQFPVKTCTHSDVTVKKFGVFNHKVHCNTCGEEWTEDCSNFPSATTDCTQKVVCTKCGNPVADGKKNHRWSAWETTGGTHTRHCLNSNCQVTESGSHTYSTAAADCTKGQVCSVCKYSTGGAYSDHAWSSWTSNGSGAHTRYCTHPGCNARQSGTHTPKAGDCGSPTVCEECGTILGAATDHNWGHWENGGSGGHYRSCLTCGAKQSTNHSGGTATCTDPAICSGCGATYGNKNPNNHAGGTELRNHKEPEVGKAGYTGDTYCLGCGALIQKGKETPALAASHTHSYGSTIHKDSTGHWKECTCGHIENGEKVAHTFKNGVCTVCGETDPSYVAPKKDHVHSTGTEYKSNETSHWKVCKDCNAAVDTAAHTYSGAYQHDATNHWRLCSVCGYKHVEAHDFQSGSCVVCGMKEGDTSASPAPSASASPAPSASAKPGASPAPGASAKPGESPQPAASAKPGESTAPNASAAPAPSGSAAPAPSGSAAPAPSGSTAPAPSNSTAPAPAATPAPTPAPTPYIPAEPVKVEDLTDLDTEAEYYESVKTVVEQGIMSGTSADTFEPEATFTRAQVAAMLYNIAGKPEVENTATFSDMGDAKWATTAVSWAQSTGVVSGTGGNTFTPNQAIDRQTLAAILYNYAKANGYDLAVDEAAVAEAQDLDQAKSFFQDAMKWAVSVGLYTPDENGNVLPEEITQRSMVAVVTVIFMRTEDITVGGTE